MEIRLFEAFAGYGSQHLAMKRLCRDYPQLQCRVVGISEIDKYAIAAYNALHPGVTNFGDICSIDWHQVPDFDLFTYSFPCTDISNAGKQAGFTEGSGTRSSLLWECQKAIEIKRPKFLLMENVKALTQKKFMPEFIRWQNTLTDFGYTNYWTVLNSKNYGVAQNRERTFMVSILGEHTPYEFPEGFPLEKRLKDVLEPVVDEKYYLSEKMLDYFGRVNADKTHGHNFTPKDGADVAFTIRTAPGQRVDDNFIKEVGRLSSSQNSRVINPDGISYAMANGEKDGTPKIVEQCDTNSYNTQEE